MDNALHTLDLVERQFSRVAALLAEGDAVQLESASVALKDLAIEMARLLPIANRSGGTSKACRQRIRVLLAGVQVLRENHSRRAAFVDQAVRVLVPTPSKSTYSAGSTVYGGAIQQSGAFKVLAA